MININTITSQGGGSACANKDSDRSEAIKISSW